MKKELTLGFSPCPNDTFMFYPLVHGMVDTGGYSFTERLEDVETLNRLALEGTLDVTKVSYSALGHIRDQYALLRVGSALGRGCGPLLVSSRELDPAELNNMTIAVPGLYTTAYLLMRLYNPKPCRFLEMPFNEVMESVTSGRADVGLIIHESRFTYRDAGLYRLADLGGWWEAETGLPIPLGGIAARRSLGYRTIKAIENALARAVDHACNYPDSASGYIRKHAQEMLPDVCAAHIALYVNDFSKNLGNDGEQAIYELFRRAEAAGLLPHSAMPLFATEDDIS